MKAWHVIGLVLATATMGSLAQAQGRDFDVDDNHAFVFYVENESSYFGDFHLSGLRHWIANGVNAQDWSAPDCLILSGSSDPLDAQQTATFLAGIEVRDTADRNGYEGVELSPQRFNGNDVYFLKGLSRYIDGISIKTKDHTKTFYGLMMDTWGVRQGNLSLVLSRGCALAQR